MPIITANSRTEGANGAFARHAIDAYGNSPNLTMTRAEGSKESPSAVTPGKSIAVLGGIAHDGTDYASTPSASIKAITTETHTPTAKGTKIEESVTKNGTTAIKVGRVLDDKGNNILADPAAPQLPTNATEGFNYVPSCNGVPTGVPAVILPGSVPKIFNTANNKEYAYSGGAWVQL